MTGPIVSAFLAAGLLLMTMSCGTDDDGGAGDPGESTELVELVVSSGDLAGTPWSADRPFGDEPDPTPNPTGCGAFDPIFALGDRPSASAELAGAGVTGAHTVRRLPTAAAAADVQGSVDRIVATCESVTVDGLSYDVAGYDSPAGRGLVLDAAERQVVIVVQAAGRVVSTIEVDGSSIEAADVASLVAAVDRRLRARIPVAD